MPEMDFDQIGQFITKLSTGADSILILGDEIDQIKFEQTAVYFNEDNLDQISDLGIFDFVLINGLLEKIKKEKAENLIAQMRDVHARQLLLIKNETGEFTSELTTNDLIRLGLRKVAEIDQNDHLFEAWYFALETYKKVPDWLNNRFWANPELYEKYRW